MPPWSALVSPFFFFPEPTGGFASLYASSIDLLPYTCQNCKKSFAAPGGLRQHFKRHDTCRLTSGSGAFSLKDEDLLLATQDIEDFLGQEAETVLVDFGGPTLGYLEDGKTVAPQEVSAPKSDSLAFTLDHAVQ